MKNTINIELFRFNAQTDYLPYYQKHSLHYDETESMSDLLVRMNEIEAFGFKVNMNIKVNELYVNASILVSELVKVTGNEIRIDPISEFRAQKDLLIDRSDFLQKLSLLDDYLDAPTNIAYRKSTELVYYASNTLNYNRDYIGDHVLLIAAELIEEKFELKHEILKLLSEHEHGIWLHTSLEKRLMRSTEERKIQKLLYLAQRTQKTPTNLCKSVATLFEKEAPLRPEQEHKTKASKVVQDFDGFNIAAYHGAEDSRLEELISDARAKSVKIPLAHADLAMHSRSFDKKFTYAIAGDILVQAKDADADFVLVNDEQTKAFFDQNQKEMEKLVGRELQIPVVSQTQFVRLLEGEQDASALGFNEHKVNVSFLSNKRVF